MALAFTRHPGRDGANHLATKLGALEPPIVALVTLHGIHGNERSLHIPSNVN